MGQIANKLLALNSAKHAIREAINEKGGGPLERWDPLSAYPGAIANIPSGGGDPAQEDFDARHRVLFIDWDGTVLSDTYVADGERVVLPELPQNEHLTFACWTHAQEDLDSVKYPMCVGARYTVEDDALFMYVKESAAVTINLKNNHSAQLACEVFWGDGSSQSFTIDGVNTVSLSHNYSSAFSGWIKVPNANGYTIRFNSASVGQITKVLAGGVTDSNSYELFSARIPTCAAYVSNVLKGCFYLNCEGTVCDFILQNYSSSWTGYGFSVIAVNPRVVIPSALNNYYWGVTFSSNRTIPILYIPEEFVRSPYSMRLSSLYVKAIVVTNFSLAYSIQTVFVFFRGTYINAAFTIGRFDVEEGIQVLSTLSIDAYRFNTFDDFCRVMRKLGSVNTTVSIKIRGCDSAQLQAVASILNPKGYTVTTY